MSSKSVSVELNVASAARLKADSASRALIGHLEELSRALELKDAVLYYDYPLFRDTDDVLYRAKVLFASRSHGLTLFATSDLNDRTVSSAGLASIDDELTQLHSLIYGKLLKSRILRRSRQNLLFTPTTAIFLPEITKRTLSYATLLESDLLFSLSALENELRGKTLDSPLSKEVWAELRSILEGAKGLVRPKDRVVPDDFKEGKAAILSRLESEINNFDAEQRRAAISIVEGPQRIRGLAGSGKTVVLAMKAAHIHLSDPSARILVTFHTKSLYDFVKRLITRFYRQFNDRDPDFEDHLHVLHSWGGRGMAGVYSNSAAEAGVKPLTYGDVKDSATDPFGHVCKKLLATGRVQQKYDYVLIDEAQDLPPAFYQLCFALAKGGTYDRNVVWAYDELQNIINVRSTSPREAFGVDSKGVPFVDLERAEEKSELPGTHDIVLHKCYRNPREILLCAHALGFGIYSEQMVQMLENKDHWEDVGYDVRQGNCEPGEWTIIERPRRNSPLSISDAQEKVEIISWYVADTLDEEVAFVVSEIQGLIAEGLRADDIMVICLDDRNARAYFTRIASALVGVRIASNNVLADVYSSSGPFVVEREVTLSTVYRAKGNEAAVVFVVGVEAIHAGRKFKRARNKLFTAFTRAKGWLRVSGLGAGAQFYVDELATALEKSPRLEFEYPDVASVDRIQRDLSDKASRVRKLQERLEREFDQLGLDDEERKALITGTTRRRSR